VDRSPASVTIRRLGAGDSLEDLTDLLHRAYRPLLDAGLRYLATHQDAATTAGRAATGECFVAETEGRVVGTVTLVSPENAEGCAYFERPGVAMFHQYAVDPAWQGRGIGARLLAHVERRAAELGAVELALDTAEATTGLIALYEKRGYRLVGRADWDVTNYQSVVMAKRLEGQTVAKKRDGS
jgi:GNAT superfamily N-acetyltransferase